MEKRRSGRRGVEIRAELIRERMSYAARVQNVSDHGVAAIISPLRNSVSLPSDSDLMLRFPLSSGDNIDFQCRKRWSSRILPDHLMRLVGLEITPPSAEFSKFVGTLP